MSRKPSKSSSRAEKAPAPLVASGRDVLKRLSELLGRGLDAPRMEREVAAVMAEWATALDGEEFRERLDEIREQLAAGIEATEEAGSEVDHDDTADSAAYSRSLRAIRATHRAFERGAERMP